MKKIISVSVAVSILVQSSYASIDSTLDNMVMGSYSMAPGIVHSPSQTTLTLGSASFRLNNDLLGKKVYNIRPPRLTTSCAGADFDAGMLSVLNVDQLSNMVGQAGASMAWGVMIGIVYSLPGVGDAFMKLNDWARAIQNLTQNSCALGTQMGKTMGSALFSKEAKGSAEERISTGLSSSWDLAQKAWKEKFQMNAMFGTSPYGGIYEAGFNDAELADLVASMFGILDWRAKDANGNDCTDKNSCADADNVGIIYYPPLITSLDSLIQGGQVTTYGCNYSYSSNLGTFLCSGGISTRSINTTGLKPKIKTKIKEIIDTQNLMGYNAGTMDSPDEAAFVMSMPIPNFTGTLNYLSSLKKYNMTSEYEAYLDATAEKVAALMVQSLINSSYSTVAELEAKYFSGKSVPDELQKAKDSATAVKTMLDSHMDRVNRNFSMVESANKSYSSVRKQVYDDVDLKYGRLTKHFMGRI